MYMDYNEIIFSKDNKQFFIVNAKRTVNHFIKYVFSNSLTKESLDEIFKYVIKYGEKLSKEEYDNRLKDREKAEKAMQVDYSNFVILVPDMKLKDIYDFGFGHNSMLIVEDTEENREKLKYLHRIRWSDIIQDYYNGRVYLSGYNFCDYTDYKNKFVSTFYFYDQEKVNRISTFLYVNENRQVDIICPAELEAELRKEIPEANYCIVNIENYIRKHIRYCYVNGYDEENCNLESTN